jgi:hypothetical protein
VIASFGRNHPAADRLGILAININAANQVIQGFSVGKFELTLKIDFDERSTVRFLRLVQLIPTITPGSLPIVKLIERVAKYARCPGTVWIERA